jgi:predicted PurR-regulated permease PerM
LDRGSDTATTAVVVLAVLGVLLALHLMQVILVPVCLALLLACVLTPFTNVLRRVLPLSATGAAVVLFLLLTVCGLFLAAVTAESLQDAANTLPGDAERLAGKLSAYVSDVLKERPYLAGILPDPGTIDALGDRNRSLLVTGLRDRLGEMYRWVGEGLMILVLVVFLLAESEMLAPRVIRFFAAGPGDARAAERTMQAVVRKIRAYLVARTVLNLGLGLAVAAVLRLLGVQFPLALGAITALASFIPYIGQVFSGVLIVLMALAHTGSIGDALIVAALYTALVGIEGYVVMPIVMGRSLDLNGTTVLLACLFWGFLWGLVGLVLAIPITVSLKLVFQYVPRLHRWAELMSRDWQTPPVVAAAPSASATPAEPAAGPPGDGGERPGARAPAASRG